MNTVGNMIKNARIRNNLDRAEAAKKLKITTSYIAHLERDDPVRLSDGLIDKLVEKIGVTKNIKRLQNKHNKRVLRFRRECDRRKQKSA